MLKNANSIINASRITGTLPVANGGTGVTTSTGTTNVVLSNSPVLVTPNLGTPSAIVLTNASGTASININGTVGATTPAAGTFTGTLGVGSAKVISGVGSAVSVAATATTIFTVAGGFPLVVVSGNAPGGLIFLDLVTYTPAGGFVVISSSSVNGSPAARTYSVSGDNLKVSLASGTYSVGAIAITGSNT